MYLVPLKSAVIEALQNTFGPDYPNPDMRLLRISIEYPAEKQDYPGIWLNFEETGPTERAGIDHRETVSDANGLHQVTRFRFTGKLSFTIGAFTSLQRDRTFDELIRVLGFATVESGPINNFRKTIENNNFMGININYDVFEASGDAANPGTPWGTNEIIYERTLSTDVIGEYVSDPGTSMLVPLSAIQVQGYVDGTLAPHFPDIQDSTPGEPWSPKNWG